MGVQKNDFSDNMKGLVSVIIPTYNRAHLLKEAIESVISQSYRPIECIVVDDGSVDDTELIISHLQNSKDEDFELVYIKKLNEGVQIARNIGTQLSRGQFIQYLDSDDLLAADKLRNQVLYLNNNINCDGIYGDWEFGDMQNKEIILSYFSDDLISQFLVERCIANFSFLMRKELVDKIGDWDVDINRNQEIDFHIRGILAGGRFRYLQGITGLWRSHQSDRVSSAEESSHVIHFYQKMEHLLRGRLLFNSELSHKIAFMYFWMIQKSIQKPFSKNKLYFKEIKRLYPGMLFLNKKIFVIISKFAGFGMACKCWVLINRRRFQNVNVF